MISIIIGGVGCVSAATQQRVERMRPRSGIIDYSVTADADMCESMLEVLEG